MFFSNDYFLFRICCDIFRAALFSEELLPQTSSKQLLRYNSYFFRAAVSSEQLLSLRSSCFRTVILQRSNFSEQLLFQSETSAEQPHLENIKFFRAVTLRNSYFWVGKLSRVKISTEEQFFQSRYFCAVLNFSEELHFGKS